MNEEFRISSFRSNFKIRCSIVQYSKVLSAKEKTNHKVHNDLHNVHKEKDDVRVSIKAVLFSTESTYKVLQQDESHHVFAVWTVQ